MGKIDRRTQLSRRRLPRATGAAVPAAMVAGASISAGAAGAQDAKAEATARMMPQREI